MIEDFEFCEGQLRQFGNHALVTPFLEVRLGRKPYIKEWESAWLPNCLSWPSQNSKSSIICIAFNVQYRSLAPLVYVN